MEGRLWLDHFTSVMKTHLKYHPEEIEFSDTNWTKFMNSVMEDVGNRLNCRVAQWKDAREESYEYLHIDAFFINKSAKSILRGKSEYDDPFVLPEAVAELENDDDPNKIVYCLWKVLCVRSPIRALVCYQEGANRVSELKRYLEEVVLEGELMKGEKGSLYVIIGDESKTKEMKDGKYIWRSKPLANVFHVYEWKDRKFVSVEGLRW